MTTEEVTIETLKRWSHILLWVSIILPLLAALAAGARYYVERYEKQLSSRLTATAIQQAQEKVTGAQTELNKLKEKTAPRNISAEQHAAMLPILTTIKDRPVAVACRLMDGESCDYATEIGNALKEAGCQVPDLIKTSVNDFPGKVVIAIKGSADLDVAKVLEKAFKAAGIPASTESVQENLVGVWYPDVVHVIVGRKAP